MLSDSRVSAAQLHPRGWRPDRRWLAVAVAATVVGFSRPASAALGDGLEIGPGRLHLGVDLNLRYDTAAAAGFSSSGSNGDLFLMAGGKFQLDVNSDNVFVNFGGAVDWNQYLGVITNDRVLSFVSATAKGEVDINKNRPIGLDITEYFGRSDQTTNPVFGLGVIALTDMTKLRLRFRPGGGAIEVGLSGEFDAGVYNAQVPAPAGSAVVCANNPSCNPNLASAFDSVQIRGGLDGWWRFLPKTGILFELLAARQIYTTNASSIGDLDATTVLANIGFGTLITTRLSFSVKVGYDGLFFAKGNVAYTKVPIDGQAEFGYKFTDAIFARVGYQRLFTPVGGADVWYGDDRIYLEMTYRAASYLSFNLGGTADFLAFGTGRSDQAYGGTLTGDWMAMAWLHITAGIFASDRQSTGEPGVALSSVSEYTYNRYIFNLGAYALF